MWPPEKVYEIPKYNGPSRTGIQSGYSDRYHSRNEPCDRNAPYNRPFGWNNRQPFRQSQVGPHFKSQTICKPVKCGKKRRPRVRRRVLKPSDEPGEPNCASNSGDIPKDTRRQDVEQPTKDLVTPQTNTRPEESSRQCASLRTDNSLEKAAKDSVTPQINKYPKNSHKGFPVLQNSTGPRKARESKQGLDPKLSSLISSLCSNKLRLTMVKNKKTETETSCEPTTEPMQVELLDSEGPCDRFSSNLQLTPIIDKEIKRQISVKRELQEVRDANLFSTVRNSRNSLAPDKIFGSQANVPSLPDVLLQTEVMNYFEEIGKVVCPPPNLQVLSQDLAWLQKEKKNIGDDLKLIAIPAQRDQFIDKKITDVQINCVNLLSSLHSSMLLLSSLRSLRAATSQDRNNNPGFAGTSVQFPPSVQVKASILNSRQSSSEESTRDAKLSKIIGYLLDCHQQGITAAFVLEQESAQKTLKYFLNEVDRQFIGRYVANIAKEMDGPFLAHLKDVLELFAAEIADPESAAHLILNVKERSACIANLADINSYLRTLLEMLAF